MSIISVMVKRGLSNLKKNTRHTKHNTNISMRMHARDNTGNPHYWKHSKWTETPLSKQKSHLNRYYLARGRQRENLISSKMICLIEKCCFPRIYIKFSIRHVMSPHTQALGEVKLSPRTRIQPEPGRAARGKFIEFGVYINAVERAKGATGWQRRRRAAVGREYGNLQCSSAEPSLALALFLPGGGRRGSLVKAVKQTSGK